MGPPPWLPLEIQERIIALAGHENRAFLLSAALVCRSWVSRSRFLLNLHVDLHLNPGALLALRQVIDNANLVDPRIMTLGHSITSAELPYPWTPEGNLHVLADTFSKIPSVISLIANFPDLDDPHSAQLMAEAFPNVRNLEFHGLKCNLPALIDYLSRHKSLECTTFKSKLQFWSFMPSGLSTPPLPPSAQEWVFGERRMDSVESYIQIFNWIESTSSARRITLRGLVPRLCAKTAEMIDTLQVHSKSLLEVLDVTLGQSLDGYSSKYTKQFQAYVLV